MKELPPRIVKKVDEIFNKKCTDMMGENIQAIHDTVKNGEANLCDILNAVDETNRTVGFIANRNKELYDQYSLKVYRGLDGSIIVVQGKRVDGGE